MALDAFFRKLDAPLKNSRWSWGAIGHDENIYLRVWQDETKKIEGKLHVCIYLSGEHDDSNPGNNERKSHIKMIENGSQCFLVMCLAKDPNATKRQIQHYNKNCLFLGGNLMKSDDDIWIEIVGKKPLK
jgi:hypothetical protein